MNPPKCVVYQPSLEIARKVVQDISYDGSSLIINILDDKKELAQVVFDKVHGFRVLDEIDLCEFWNEYSEPNGWLYEVIQGGWKDLESSRKRFVSLSMEPNLKEYLLVDDICVSVFTTCEPKLISNLRER